jgi:uncharacterized membrane protein
MNIKELQNKQILLLCLLTPALLFYKGFIFSMMWNWFAPLIIHGTMHITSIVGAAIMFLTYFTFPKGNKKETLNDMQERGMFSVVLEKFIEPSLDLFFAYIIHLLITHQS